jgi:DNA-directed RNA polymerase subunit H (RpoH/RPB5)
MDKRVLINRAIALLIADGEALSEDQLKKIIKDISTPPEQLPKPSSDVQIPQHTAA